MYSRWLMSVFVALLMLAPPLATGGVIVSLVGDKDNAVSSVGDPTGMDAEY